MAFAVFDIETRIDKHLLKQTFFPRNEVSEQEAYEKFREELHSDFFPTSLHIPISIAVGNVGDDHVLNSIETLALENYSEENLVREFWTRAEKFNGSLVSFNGRRFDLPVMELQALRYGIAAPAHFAEQGGGRDRYSAERHYDLMDFLSNYGAFSIRGGLDLLLKMIGMPGKGEIHGAHVQELYEQGRLDEVHRYCRSDVIQTYFLFLRVELMRGRLSDVGYNAVRAASEKFANELTAAS